MNKTNDFKYNLPAYSDPVDIEDLNDNFRGIDDALMAGLCKKDYTGNNMGSSDPSARKYAWAPWLEIVNDNEFDVVVTDRNAPVESEEATINIAAGQTFRKFINGRYYMNFYVQDQHDVTFKWFTNAETYINESGGGGGGTGTVTSVSVQGGSGSHLTGSGNPIETSGTITINVDEGYSIPSDNEQTAWDGKAADLKAEIDSSTYVLTLQLKDSAGNLIGTAKTIDLPLETMVVDGEYDSQTKKIKLELKNGNYVEFSVADLVSGLQTELSASNKLDPDYIDYDSTHRAVTDTEKDTWNGKQNALTFDDTPTQNSNNPVKSGGIYTALAGKQASLDSTQLAAVNSGIDSTKVGQISTNQTNILYTAETGVKNRIILNDTFSIAPPETTGLTVTNNGDGTLTVSGTPTNTNADNFIYITIGKFYYSADKYRIENQHIGTNGYYYTNDIHLNSNVESGMEYTYTSAGSTPVVIRLTKNTTYPSQVVYPMIRPAFITDTTFQPGALPNYDLTRLESEDRASLAEVVDSGAKNLLKRTASGSSWTDDNVTFTLNSDGSITINSSGAITANRYFAYFEGRMSDLVSTAGNYVLFASASPNAQVQVWWYYTDDWTNVIETSGNASRYISASDLKRPVIVRIRALTGNAISNVKVYPMLCTKAAFGVSKAFVPYRPNYDLVCQVAYAGGYTGVSSSNADLNDIPTSEFRVYNNPSNMPSGTSGYCWVRTNVIDVNSAMQEMTLLNTDSNSYVRVKAGGTWRAWKQTTNA